MSLGTLPLGTLPLGTLEAGTGSTSHALEGAASAEASAQGTITVTGQQDLDGAAAGVATASGDLTHTVKLAGAPKGVALASGNLSKTDTLAGAAFAGHSIISRPVSDIAAGNFVSSAGGALYAALDEVAADDADYIYNTSNVFVWTRIGLGAIPDPGTHTGQRLNFRAWNVTGVGTAYAFVYLHQGETVIAMKVQELASATPQTFSVELTEAEAAAITDYSALELRLLITAGTVAISWAGFETTIPGIEATGALSVSVPLAGAGITVATADGAMSVSIPLAGSALAQAQADAGITHDVPLAGTGVTTYARPTADLSVGSNWTASSGTDMFAMLDEATTDDSDYVACDINFNNLALRLGGMSHPAGHHGHTLVIRAKTQTGASGYINYAVYASTAAYLASAEPIKSGYVVGSTDFTTNEIALGSNQAAGIVDYDDIVLSINGLACTVLTVSQAYLRVTQSAVATATGDLSVTAGGVVDLAAAATATATASGDLSLSIPLSGSAVAQALAQAGITHVVPLAGAAASGHTVYARPNGDIASAGVVITGAATLHEALGEAEPNDSTYITWGSGDTAEVALGDIADPGVSTGHRLSFRAWTTAGWLAVQLKQGATVIADKFYYGDGPTAHTTVTVDLTPAQADSITDYSALSVSLFGLLGEVSYSWVEFSVDVPGAEATGDLTHDVTLDATADIQYVLPSADIALGTWTPTAATAWESLADGAGYNGHYVTSDTVDAALELSLSPVAAPASSSKVRIIYAAACPTQDGLVSIQLYCGATLIRSTMVSVIQSVMAEKFLLLTAAQVAAITDWSALTFKVYGAGTVVQLHKIHVQIESGAVATASAGGNLSINVSLSGDAISEAAASAGLSVAGGGAVVDLAGNAQAQASAAGAIAHGVPLSGAALTVSSASGNVTHIVPLSGSAASISTVTGSLDVAVMLDGAALASALAAAGITSLIGLDADAASDAVADGTITLRVVLAGDAAAQAADGAATLDAFAPVSRRIFIQVSRITAVAKLGSRLTIQVPVDSRLLRAVRGASHIELDQ